MQEMKTVNFLEALEAAKQGKKIRRAKGEVQLWWTYKDLQMNELCVDDVEAQWIIESKPMEIWVNFWNDGTTTEYLTKRQAEDAAKKINKLASTSELYCKIVKIAKFREVTDE